MEYSRLSLPVLSVRGFAGWENLNETINRNVYSERVKSAEFKRWLAEQGAAFKPGKGSHLKVSLNNRHSVLPMHGKELKKGLVEGIKKQLGLK